jgi:hypothetical protein
MRKVGFILFLAWAVVFFCGAVGELFGIGFLRDLTDLKGIFLR